MTRRGPHTPGFRRWFNLARRVMPELEAISLALGVVRVAGGHQRQVDAIHLHTPTTTVALWGEPGPGFHPEDYDSAWSDVRLLHDPVDDPDRIAAFGRLFRCAARAVRYLELDPSTAAVPRRPIERDAAWRDAA